MTLPNADAMAAQHSVAPPALGAREAILLDLPAAAATVASILDRRTRVPSRATITGWHERLRSDLDLLTAAMTERIEAKPYAGTRYAAITALALSFIQDKAAAGLPGDPELAYGTVRDLARHCRTLLGLVADEPSATQ
ncbi:DUF6415 family natural product biosynthesis protein [Streptomyces sp. NPDC020719]|uniref:DUF6415 family natural product biosynthesis protein n=1 Tax=Streptomyces sp. NPDC020719 TaxID=3154896 RepID=UPI0033EF8147